MSIEFDHLFVCVSPDAPEAEQLVQFGLLEGAPSQHPGQGTANRRFSLRNAMIELIWVHDAEEAQSQSTRPTLLWDRWAQRNQGSCPFGICVRPVEGSENEIPFPGWAYTPSYLPPPLAFLIGEADLAEPMWVYMSFMRRSGRETHFRENPLGIREITQLVLTTPTPLRSSASRAMLDSGVIASRLGPEYLLEVEFDGRRTGQLRDFRPVLPLLFHF